MSRVAVVAAVLLVTAACGGKVEPLARDDEVPSPPEGPRRDVAPGGGVEPITAPDAGAPDASWPEARPTCAKPAPAPRTSTRGPCGRWSVVDRKGPLSLEPDGRAFTADSTVESAAALRADLMRQTGRVYFEVRIERFLRSVAWVGLATPNASLASLPGAPDACVYDATGIVTCPGAPTALNGIVWTPGSTVAIAADLSRRTASFAVDGIWLGCTSATGFAAVFPLPRGPLMPAAGVALRPYEPVRLVASFRPEDLEFAPPPGFDEGFCDGP